MISYHHKLNAFQKTFPCLQGVDHRKELLLTCGVIHFCRSKPPAFRSNRPVFLKKNSTNAYNRGITNLCEWCSGAEREHVHASKHTSPDQRTTGNFWSSFEALAQYLVALSASMPATTVTASASNAAGTRFSRVHVMKTQGAKKKLHFAPRGKQPQLQRQQAAKKGNFVPFHQLSKEEQLQRPERHISSSG